MLTKQAAIALANTLANEADEEGTPRIYHVLEAANQDLWTVQESVEVEGALHPLQVWVSPEISFPLQTE